MSHCLKRIYLLIALLSTLGFSSYALGAVPDGISFQAYLTNADGSVIDSDVSITFVAYNVDVGGAPLWTQTETVPVNQGLFSLTLGNPVNPFPANLFDGPVYIGLSVAGEELLPRRALTSSAYSFKASDADTLTGISASALDQSAHVGNTANPHSVTVAQIGAADSADIAALQTQLNAALAAIATLQNEVSNLQSAVTANDADIVDIQNDVISNDFGISSLDGALTGVQTNVAAIQGNSVLALDGILAMSGQNAVFTGVNLQVVNGTGTTQGNGNGLGNILIGYNEAAGPQGFYCSIGDFLTQSDCLAIEAVWSNNHKSGSHNLVVGGRHNYSRDSGIVAGVDNSILGQRASVISGEFNAALGNDSSVSGGGNNTAIRHHASVSGGENNTASNIYASVSGGRNNIASGQHASVSGGGGFTSVQSNNASGNYASVSGGVNGTASGEGSSISGGVDGLASGVGSSVSGGKTNTATARWATVSGGANRNSTGEADWRAGALFQEF